MEAKRYILTMVCGVLMLSMGTIAQADKVPGVKEGREWDLVPLTGGDVPETEPNNTPQLANAFNCGETLRPAAINIPGDEDFIVFSANNGQTITFGTNADGALPTVDTIIELRASDGITVLAFDDDSGPGLYSLLTHVATYTGTYYGRIAAFAANQTGSYQAFVTCADPVVCDLTDYKPLVQEFPTPVPVPDADPNGVQVGTINTVDDQTVFVDVVVSLEIDHTFVGDLIATVSYDVECNGVAEASARVLCRPGREFCEGPEAPFGCGSDLSCNNTYFFSDAGGGEVGLPPACGGAVVPGGCYLPDSTGEPLSVFDGLRKGGCFKLHVVDNAGLDVGSVCAWAVYTLNEEIVPVESTTWGRIKTLHR